MREKEKLQKQEDDLKKQLLDLKIKTLNYYMNELNTLNDFIQKDEFITLDRKDIYDMIKTNTTNMEKTLTLKICTK